MKKKSDIKVATMTFHMAHNYGAMLQAYALQEAVRKLGYSCEVLDYRFPHIDQWSGIRIWKDLRQESGLLWGTARWLWRVLNGYYRSQGEAQKKFNAFMKQKMHLSRKTYFCAEELRDAKYDAVIFGSDQIWNPALTDGVADEYFGSFVNTERTRLISYAASCGKNRFSEEYEKLLLPKVRRFHKVGIREEGFTKWLSEVQGIPAQTVLDPVFLLTPQEWDTLLQGTPARIKEPYLLVYAFDTTDDIFILARRIAAERKLKLVAVCYNETEELRDMLQLTDCGPLEFLRLFRDASFVCTTSFHGEAFSIIFEKDFYCLGHPAYGQRNVDLLKVFGLEGRLISHASDVVQVQSSDYSEVRICVERERIRSKKFIADSIEQ